MSVTYNIICKKCKKSLWIAQSSRNFYSGEPHTMKALGEFLFDHMGLAHTLLFDAPEFYDSMLEPEWEEIDANKYKEHGKD